MTAPVGVIGGGRFGRALAGAVSRHGLGVRLWTRRPDEIDLEGVFVTNLPAELEPCELVFVCVPSPHVERIADLFATHLDGGHLLVHVSRGLIGSDLVTVGDVLMARTPVRRVGAMAGPISAHALEAGDPSGVVVGSRFPETTVSVRRVLAKAGCRVYGTDDRVGVELASALAGLVALAVGIASGLGLGPSMRAVLAARGMVEAARVVRSRNGRWATLQGLAGWGDLAAALLDPTRPELAYGKGLGEGRIATSETSHDEVFIEGRSLCRNVVRFAQSRGIEVPLLEALDAVLGGTAPHDAMKRLLARPVGSEGIETLGP